MPKKFTNRLVAGTGITLDRAAPDDREVTISATATGDPVAIEDDGTPVIAEVATLNFGDNLVVTDDTGGKVTIDATGGGGSYAETVGDGVEDTFTITHSLDTADVVVVAWEVSTGEQLAVAVTVLTVNSVRVVFTVAPDTDDARVVVLASGGSGGGGGSAIVADVKRRTAGNVSANTSWAAVDTDLDITLPAVVGDLIEVEVSAMWDGASNWGQLQVWTMDGATEVTAFGGTANGVPGWLGHNISGNGGITGIGGAVALRLVADDIVAGEVTVRLFFRVNSGSRTLRGSAGDPIIFMARNLGQQ
jgi:hypothetical protein